MKLLLIVLFWGTVSAGVNAAQSVESLAFAESREASLRTLRTAAAQSNGAEQLLAAAALFRLGYFSDIPRALYDIPQERAGEGGSVELQRRALKLALSPQGEERRTLVRQFLKEIATADPSLRLEIVSVLLKFSEPLGDPEFQAVAAAVSNEPWQNQIAAALIKQSANHTQSAASIVELLRHSEPEARIAAANALQHMTTAFDPTICASLASAIKTETNPQASAALQVAQFLASDNAVNVDQLKLQLFANAASTDSSLRTMFAEAMATLGDDTAQPRLVTLLDDPVNAVRIASANAILRIDRRRTAGVSFLDWAVLAIYGLGMIGVGWYYSRSSSVEDYMLGGREMKPWAVGISLFATLMSTLTYLAMPGEMIQHGPMILCGFLSYPLIYLVVSRLIIPFIMRLQVTSAYEILELRLGLSVRLLGSAIFLVLRLLWMGMIAYATSSVVLIPLLGLDESATPWACAGMALCTVAYTSAGGLRAVVATDVLQTCIMLAGAILSLILISNSLGGVGAWWPREWAPHWDAPSLLFAKDSRVSAGLAFLSTLTWYICTSGSDQMAIQRYLATRDAKSASRMFGISLWCDAIVALLLAVLGLALVAYSSVHPEILPDGQTLLSSADKLFPQFVVKALPAGLSGLVVAGVLSAAMDSLSSGLNSASSVILSDWVERFRFVKTEGHKAVREAKLISWLVGIAVVLLSLFAGIVAGNLLEKCFTVVNLFTASLFVLFFMAMFVPWATTFGAWLGAIASICTAVSMAYGDWLNLSFLWITPISLLTGIVVGCLVSMLPIGVAQPMLTPSNDEMQLTSPS